VAGVGGAAGMWQVAAKGDVWRRSQRCAGVRWGKWLNALKRGSKVGAQTPRPSTLSSQPAEKRRNAVIGG